MKRMRPFRLSALLLGVAVLLPLRAAADNRLAGYWTSAPGESEQAVFSFSILGRWTIVSQHWNDASPDLKVKYTTVTTGNTGTLTADENLDKLPAAPHTISYEVEAGELLLAFPGTGHAGRYRLVKSSPPFAPARPTGTVDLTKPAPAVRPRAPAATAVTAPNPLALLGAWSTEPGAPVQVSLFIGRSRTGDLKINQEWIKGSDNPAVSRNGDYTASFANGRGMLNKAKADFEGSEIPLRLYFALEGDALVITVDDGAFAGQHRLLKKNKPEAGRQ